LEEFWSNIRYDEVCHLASSAAPPWYMEEPRRSISANVLSAMRLLSLLKPNRNWLGQIAARSCEVSGTGRRSRMAMNVVQPKAR
ncbi:NAD-dependent epimerase/dehydratase family protein, partial [Raoultella planticola]|uniref:NAD-dependent epimerase/dehydratase family protein n=1 Tax=Raoultella planticola TaxID=575 RepID=UPI0035C9390E|nr:NAD-dependent epimerase/dehydratase family protein [Raoultella planticola]